MVQFRNFRIRKITLITVLSFVTLSLFGGIAYAISSDAVVQGTTNQTIYKAGNNVDITGTVNGDIYCAGQTVVIDARVNGDVICAAQTITVNGNVSGNIRVAGQNITIGADVSNNISVAGQTVVLQNNSRIGRDALIAGQTVTIDGAVLRDVNLASNTATISQLIGRNVDAKVGDHLVLTANAKVGGNFSYTSPRLWDKGAGAQVAGTTTYHKSNPSHNSWNWAGLNIIWSIYWLVAVSIFAVILVSLFPQLFRKWSSLADQHIGFIFLTGFIAMLVMPMLIILSFVTVIGVPVGLLLLLLWIIDALLSIPFAAFALANKLVPTLHPVLMVLIGSLLLGIVGLIPILGWIIGFLAYLFGTGTILWNLKSAYKKPNYSAKSAK